MAAHYRKLQWLSGKTYGERFPAFAQRRLETAVRTNAGLAAQRWEQLWQAMLGQSARLIQQAQLWHAVRLMAGAAEALSELGSRNILLGLASNSQP